MPESEAQTLPGCEQAEIDRALCTCGGRLLLAGYGHIGRNEYRLSTKCTTSGQAVVVTRELVPPGFPGSS